MKRAIKYYNIYNNDGAEFSCCSTKYEILEGLYPDTAGVNELKAIAKDLGFVTNGVVSKLNNRDKINITDAIKLKKRQVRETHRGTEKLPVYLGFVELPKSELAPVKKTLNNKLPKDFLNEVVNSGEGYRLGIDEYGYHQTIKGDILVMTGWHFYHILPLLGYSIDKMLKSNKIEDCLFFDSVQMCSGCYEYDDESDGYRYKHITTDDGTFCKHCIKAEDVLIEVTSPEEVFNAKNVSDFEIPEEFEEVQELFCDNSGFGSPNEPALTKNGTLSTVARLLKEHGTLYAGITDVGQFQVYVTLYKKHVIKQKGKVA